MRAQNSQSLLKLNRLVLSLFFLSLNLFLIAPLSDAIEKRGADVLIRNTDGTEVMGELIAVKPDSLLIMDLKTGADISTPVSGINHIKIIKLADPWKGAKIGFLIGAASRIIYGLVWPGDEEPAAYFPPVYGATFAVPGALAGAISSGLMALDKTYLIQGRPPWIIKTTLNDLKSKARVADFN